MSKTVTVPLEKNPNTSDPWRCPETQNAREEKTKKTPHKGPQKEVDKFWDKFINRNPNELHTILPRNAFAGLKALHEIEGPTYAQAAHSLYEQAEAAYRAAVEQISKECRRTNTRYRDPYFDLEFDLKKGHRQCLEGLLVGNKLEKYNIGIAKSVPVSSKLNIESDPLPRTYDLAILFIFKIAAHACPPLAIHRFKGCDFFVI